MLIEAKNTFYAFDICPGFWNWIKAYQEMRSIQMVKYELLDGKDALSEWVDNELPKDYFLLENEAIQQEYSNIVNYVYGLSQFDTSKKNVFS